MKTIYYKMPSDVADYLQAKYNATDIQLDHVGYEQSLKYNGGHFIANIYRMPSGNYEVVDYAIKSGYVTK